MRKFVAMLAAAALSTAVVAIFAVSAPAVSPSQQQCTTSGGSFSRSHGTVTCENTTTTLTDDTVSLTTTTSTTGQGNLGNKTQTYTSP